MTSDRTRERSALCILQHGLRGMFYFNATMQAMLLVNNMCYELFHKQECNVCGMVAKGVIDAL